MENLHHLHHTLVNPDLITEAIAARADLVVKWVGLAAVPVVLALANAHPAVDVAPAALAVTAVVRVVPAAAAAPLVAVPAVMAARAARADPTALTARKSATQKCAPVGTAVLEAHMDNAHRVANSIVQLAAQTNVDQT